MAARRGRMRGGGMVAGIAGALGCISHSTTGLDSVAETVYRAMLRHPAAGVADLGDAVGLSEEEVRDALDTLSELARTLSR